eukprot:3182878-Pleurochrysis_carterae.AAC.1
MKRRRMGGKGWPRGRREEQQEGKSQKVAAWNKETQRMSAGQIGVKKGRAGGGSDKGGGE